MKADTPASIPASIESARMGLALISAGIVSPAGTDSYNQFVEVEPMMNNISIATINATDHLPDIVFGVMLQGCLSMLSSFLAKNDAFIRLCALANHFIWVFLKKHLL